jgi:hypothetical protein
MSRPVLIVVGGSKTGLRIDRHRKPRDFAHYARETAATGIWRI